MKNKSAYEKSVTALNLPQTVMGEPIIRKRMYAPLQKSYVKYTKNRYYLATINISTFSNISIIT